MVLCDKRKDFNVRSFVEEPTFSPRISLLRGFYLLEYLDNLSREGVI